VIPAACRLAWTFCASVLNEIPFRVKSLGKPRLNGRFEMPDAASSALALVRSNLALSAGVSAPRNMLGTTPGVWIAPAPASCHVRRVVEAVRMAFWKCWLGVILETFGLSFASRKEDVRPRARLDLERRVAAERRRLV